MIEGIVVVVTLVPVLLGIALGRRAGLRKTLRGTVVLLVSWGAAALAAGALFRAEVFEPLGLVTPVAAGFLVLIVVAGLLKRRRSLGSAASKAASGAEDLQPGEDRVPSGADRAAGALAGGVLGAASAVVLWLVVILADAVFVETPTSGPPTASESAQTAETTETAGREPAIPAPATAAPAEADLFHAVLRTANHGFIRHLPLVGPLGDEFEALSVILHARPGESAFVAREFGWDRLAELPTYRAIVEDAELMKDVDRAASGNVRSLYRLQRDARVIAFAKEEPVRRAIAELRPTDIARRIEEMREAPADAHREGE